jgi:hypothetical protein
MYKTRCIPVTNIIEVRLIAQVIEIVERVCVFQESLSFALVYRRACKHQRRGVMQVTKIIINSKQCKKTKVTKRLDITKALIRHSTWGTCSVVFVVVSSACGWSRHFRFVVDHALFGQRLFERFGLKSLTAKRV